MGCGEIVRPTLASAFPRVADYLQSLPDGIDSHPQAMTKASVYQAMALLYPVQGDLTLLPKRVCEELTSPSPMSSWISTVVCNCIELAAADIHHLTAEQFINAAYEMNQRLLSTPMYRALIFVSSRRMLVRMGANAWKRFHRGSDLTIQFGEGLSILVLTFPENLHPELILLEKAQAFRAADVAVGGKSSTIEIVERSPTMARYHLHWGT